MEKKEEWVTSSWMVSLTLFLISNNYLWNEMKWAKETETSFMSPVARVIILCPNPLGKERRNEREVPDRIGTMWINRKYYNIIYIPKDWLTGIIDQIIKEWRHRDSCQSYMSSGLTNPSFLYLFYWFTK